MSATNKTTHYELPVFLGSDKPAWLVDWNGAMADIDSAIYEAKTTADGAASSVSTVAADLSTLSTTVSGQGGDISTISTALTTLNGTVNTITSLIGNGTPTTDDKTIIGAINEINAKVVAPDADDVSYSNTLSGLSATNVQDAIDELATGTPTGEKRVISIGDSYAITQAGVTSSYVTPLAALFGASVDLYDLHQNGMGLTPITSPSDPTALTLLQSESANIPNHDTITDIIITVGENDSNNVDMSGIPTAITTLCAYIKTEYPNAKIHYGFIGNIMSCPDVNRARIGRWLSSIPMIMNGFADNGADVMDGIQYVCHDARNLYSPAYSHPNDTGASEIAKFIYNWIMTGHAKYYKEYEYAGSQDVPNYRVLINGPVTTVSFVTRADEDASGTVAGATKIVTTVPSDFPIRGAYNYEFTAKGQIGLTISGQGETVQFALWKGDFYAIKAGSAAYTNITAGNIVADTIYM